MRFLSPRSWALCSPALVALMLAACGGGGGGDAGGLTAPPLLSHLSVTASGPAASVASGSATVLQVVVTNTGKQVARNVRGTVQLGAGLTLLSVTCGAVGAVTCPADPATLGVDVLPVGASLRFDVLVALASGQSGTIVSTVAVQADGETPSSDSAATVTISSFSTDLRVTGTPPPAPVVSGSAATYTMTVTNAGPDAARDVRVEVTADVNQKVGTILCAASGGAQCPAKLAATMDVPVLPVDATVVFSVSTTVASSAHDTIDATLSVGTIGDPVTGNNAKTVTAATTPLVPGTPSFVVLESDADDYIGQGANLSYTQADAVLVVTAVGNRLDVSVTGDQGWTATFALPSALGSLQPGTYGNLQRYPFHDPAVGGLDWYGEGRGCNRLTGTIVVDGVTYVAGQLTSIDLHFDQHCETGPAALHGRLHWLASDTTSPPGPLMPPPSELWAPPPGALPTSGNYVYLQSDPGDYIGLGKTLLYTPPTSLQLTASASARVTLSVDGVLGWTADFAGMNTLTQLQPGYYGRLQRYPFYNPTRGGLDWHGEGRGCNKLSGWFVVDSIAYVGNVISSLDLRFEQHCEGDAPALRGKVHWEN